MRLIVFGGRPGCGKSTLARALANRSTTAVLRLDEIEQAIRSADGLTAEVGVAGYAVANALAEANLALGVSVIVDAVNPVVASRAAWIAIAQRTSARLTQIEVVCSDPAEHRRRVEHRVSDIDGLMLPTWADVLNLTFEPWTTADLCLDTAGRSVDVLCAAIEAFLGQNATPPA